MQINLTDQEFKSLLKHLAIANTVIWVISEVNDKYIQSLENSDNLIDKILQQTNDKNIFDIEDWKRIFKDTFYDQNLEELDDYEDWTFRDNLAYKLAEQEVQNTNSEDFQKKYEMYIEKLENNWFKYIKYFWWHK